MRGTPSLHLLALACLFAILAIPLAKLTGSRPGSIVFERDEVAPESEPEETPAFLTIRYAHPPEHLKLSVSGRTLVDETRFTESPLEADVRLPALENGLEVAVQTAWPAGTPETALTVEVEPEAVPGMSVTVWSLDGQIDTVLVFESPRRP